MTWRGWIHDRRSRARHVTRINVQSSPVAIAAGEGQRKTYDMKDPYLDTQLAEGATVQPLGSEPSRRVAVVLHSKTQPGEAANAAAIVVGGLRCAAFDLPIQDTSGFVHAAVRWNLVVLQARNVGQLEKLANALQGSTLEYVLFTSSGRSLSNSFDEYKHQVESHSVDFADIIALGIFGEDDQVRAVTKSFSVFK